MAKATDLRLDEPQCMLFKSSPGFGKTLAACSFALGGPVYLSYWDKKKPIEIKTYFTKKRFGERAEKIMDNITFDVYDASNPHQYLNKMIKFAQDCRYFALVNDSLTFMTSSCVNWSLTFGSDKEQVQKIKEILPSWDEYKVETSLVTRCLDLSKNLPCHVIWTAHPLPVTKVEGGTGSSMRVSKANSLVSYGNKVAGIVPGSFTEIYHFSQYSDWDSGTGKSSKRFVCNLESVGDEFAKSPLLGDYCKELDFTNKLFYEVWMEALGKATNALKDEVVNETTAKEINPFATQQSTTGWKV